MKIITLILTLTFSAIITVSQSVTSVGSQIARSKTGVFPEPNAIIRLKFNRQDFKENRFVSYTDVNYIGSRKWKIEEQNGEGNIFQCKMNIAEPVYLDINGLFESVGNQKNRYHIWWLVEPGDNVDIISTENGLLFTGNGADKYRLQYLLDSMCVKFREPSMIVNTVTPGKTLIDSLDRFIGISRDIKSKMESILRLIELYKSNISSYAYNLIKANNIDQFIEEESGQFSSFRKYAKHKKINNQVVCSLYDSIYLPLTEKWLQFVCPYTKGNQGPIMNMVYRQHGFDDEKAPLNSNLDVRLMFYKKAINIYAGLVREQFITEYFPHSFMVNVGFIPEVEKMLHLYYSEPGYPNHKAYMKEKEIAIRDKMNAKAAPQFELYNKEGQVFRKDNVLGKIAILYFDSTEKDNSRQLNNDIDVVKKRFKDDTAVVFVNISVVNNKDQWLKGARRYNNSYRNELDLYIANEETENAILRKYAITNYPSVCVINFQGNVIRTYRGGDQYGYSKSLIELILKHIAYVEDGPYILHEDRSAISYNIHNGKLTKKTYKIFKKQVFNVHTDLDGTFSVKIKKRLTVEPSVYEKPEKLMALSDIEGNFDAFRKLLQSNKIIDEDYNWVFGKGHLVFAGDMFDRGNQVTECLWLMYSLEEKAKKEGGYVHFVLGNHEIMNMQGNHRYTQLKYKKNAGLIGKTLAELYNADSELGRWLRTKNVMEKIGDLLVVHGGVSQQVLRMSLTIGEMNDLVRPYYGNKNIDSGNKHLIYLYGSKKMGPENSFTSPFWFRGYYGDIDNLSEIPTMQQLDSTLEKFGVSRIITGHTIVADTVSVHYKGKVINTDTKHAHGKSEALLIDGECYYRVNHYGQKKLLFIDDKRRLLEHVTRNN